jgi:hypothetical protein
MHTAKKELYKKEKPCYSDQILVAATLTPPNQHGKSNPFKSDASKKKTVHKHRRRRIKRSYVFTLEKVLARKTIPSTRSLPDTINKGQTLGFHPLR